MHVCSRQNTLSRVNQCFLFPNLCERISPHSDILTHTIRVALISITSVDCFIRNRTQGWPGCHDCSYFWLICFWINLATLGLANCYIRHLNGYLLVNCMFLLFAHNLLHSTVLLLNLRLRMNRFVRLWGEGNDGLLDFDILALHAVYPIRALDSLRVISLDWWKKFLFCRQLRLYRVSRLLEYMTSFILKYIELLLVFGKHFLPRGLDW